MSMSEFGTDIGRALDESAGISSTSFDPITREFTVTYDEAAATAEQIHTVVERTDNYRLTDWLEQDSR